MKQFSATAFITGKRSPGEYADFCAGSGLSGLECAPPMLSGMTDDEISRLGLALKEARVEISTFHLPFGTNYDISSFYETRRRRAVSELRGWISKAILLGSSVGIIHPSSAKDPVEIEGLDRFQERLIESVDDLIPTCESGGFALAVENMLPAADSIDGVGYRYFSQPEHIERFAEACTDTLVGFCLDTGHALVAMSPDRELEIVDAMGERVIAFHLSDTPGDKDMHIAPGRGNVNWSAYTRHPAVTGFDGVFCIETPPFAFGPNYDIGAWRTLVEETRSVIGDV